MGGDGNVPLKQTRVGVIRQGLQQASNSIHSEFKLRRAPLLPFPHPFSLHPLYFPSRRFRPPTYVGMRRSRCAYAVESEQTVAVSESDGGGGVG